MGVGGGGNCGGEGEGGLFSGRGKPIHRVKYSGMGAGNDDLEVYEYVHGPCGLLFTSFTASPAMLKPDERDQREFLKGQ